MTEPLTPPDLDLRDFQYMPIEITRLFGSQFHSLATDAEWRAGMILWLKSFHQVPAASIPDDDAALARLAEFGRDVRGWRKVRDVALRGWIKCSDDRLYHPVVADKALIAWIEKLGKRKSSEAGNAKRWGTTFDSTLIDSAISHAAGLLSALNPQSRTLSKKFVVASRCDPGGTKNDPGGTPADSPGGNPEIILVGSQEKDKGNGNGKGKGVNIARGAPAERPARAEASKPKRSKPATAPMPDRASPEFAALKAAFCDYGRTQQLPDQIIADEFEGFTGHHQAKGSVFADWVAAGQNWLRRTRQFSQPRSGAPNGRPQI